MTTQPMQTPGEVRTLEGAEVQAQADHTWERLESEIEWYDRKSGYNQRMYKRTKIIQLVAAATLPVLVGVDLPSWVAGSLGALIVVIEGIQQLNQYQHNWITYRSTCEALRHERYLYLGNAGPYTDPAAAHATLADRIEGLISQEHAKWTSAVAKKEEPEA